MAPNKTKGRANNQLPPPQPSDYETDVPPQQIDIQPPPPRSNEELNLSVLRRHYPDIVSIVHIAQYAAVYIYSRETQAWEKSGVEGTLFACELTPSLAGADRFGAVILNRRGLDNFRIEIPTEEELDISEGYVVMQGSDGIVYGLWIFSEPETSTENNSVETAEKFRALARQTSESRLIHETGLGSGAGTVEQVEESVPMGRQLSLRELFGQQRAQDAAWSVHDHHSPGMSSGFATTPDPPIGNNVLAQLFIKAKQDYNGVG
ncbi:hypothetical protein BCR34DRAFT_596802 [Clohesyomyces aquaticus]|uniref:PH domain-like protein n=1 Tax=Clohesyomyces aquaticus TaxID=1231657 RepID=A0A1Y2A552_9PLEO|nr:hypothetical protein BCR34DRAFT_596802 [Clohesyomyces aquaticus]